MSFLNEFVLHTLPGVQLLNAFLEGLDIACVVAGGGFANLEGDATLAYRVLRGVPTLVAMCTKEQAPKCCPPAEGVV